MQLIEKYKKVCEELGLELDTDLNEKIPSTLNYKMLYQPGDLEDYSTFGREGIIITRFAVDKNLILVWDDYIMRDGKAYSNKGQKPTQYKTMRGIKAHLQRVIHAYEVYVKQWKEKILEAKIELIQDDFE